MPRAGPARSTFAPDLKIRKARPSDAPVLAQLEQDIFPSDRMSRRRFAALARRPTARVLVACQGREVAGYAILLTRRGIRSARLYSLAVAPRAAGRGIGKRLLAEAEAAALRRRARRVRLEVRADNRRAIRLYEKAGYQLIGERPGYYSDGMTALLYARDLPPAERRRAGLSRRAA
jgi:ribosomal protein S18 acetylase RimI-like enzyme